MNRRNLRNYACIAVAALSGVLEAPRLAHAPLGAVSADIAGAVTKVAAAVTGKHMGFDTNVYPGDSAMDAWKQSGEYEWVGYYLSAPCHSDDSWSGTRSQAADRTVGGWPSSTSASRRGARATSP